MSERLLTATLNPERTRPWNWLWIPAAIAIGLIVFNALEGLATPHHAPATPVFVVNKVAKVFVPPPHPAPAAQRRQARVVPPNLGANVRPNLPAVFLPPLPPATGVLWRVAPTGGGIEQSFDGGVTWETAALPQGISGSVTSVVQKIGLIAIETSTGQHWSSTDGGLNWR